MIGIFDSGFGGLTILRALIAAMPQYSYVYLGDNAHAPYGNKSTKEIIELTRTGVDFLFSRGASIVILGCNTASAAALRELQQTWLPQNYPSRRLLGIVVPTIEQITGADWWHESPITTPISADVFTVGVLATPATVATNTYPTEVHKRNQSVRVIQQACPDLVAAIEAQSSADELRRLVRQYSDALVEQSAGNLHAVLLGCTHFELIAPIIALQLPSGMRIYHQPSIVAASLKYYLQQHSQFAAALDTQGQRQFFTTGGSSALKNMVSDFGISTVVQAIA